MRVRPTSAQHAVQWPEGGVAQISAKRDLESMGVKVSLYDGAIQKPEGEECFADGSSFQWKYAATDAQTWPEVGDWILVLAEGLTATLSDAEFRARYETEEQA